LKCWQQTRRTQICNLQSSIFILVETMVQANAALTGLSGIIAAGGGASTLVNDTFTDSNGTNLTAHTPDIRPGSNAWGTVSGTQTVQSNQANASASGYYTIDAGQADVTITYLVTPTAAGNGWGITARRSDANNGWDPAINPVTNQIQIYEQAAGVYTLRASTSFTVSNGVQYTLQAVLSGSTITLSVNGGNQISYNSATSNQSVTRHGSGLNSGWTGDNFKVTSP
jgi:hypothetical protein